MAMASSTSSWTCRSRRTAGSRLQSLSRWVACSLPWRAGAWVEDSRVEVAEFFKVVSVLTALACQCLGGREQGQGCRACQGGYCWHPLTTCSGKASMGPNNVSYRACATRRALRQWQHVRPSRCPSLH
eukprot:358454-Chlamydomonas_euryale.AAC.7